MKIEIKIMILSVLISSIVLSSISFMSIEKSFAQSDDHSGNNAIGQEGDGNEAAQSDETTQETDQNSMCVSGDSTSLSCNNSSVEDDDGIIKDTNSISGKIYVIDGPTVNSVGSRASSTANCNPGDSIISGFLSASSDPESTNTQEIPIRSISENLDPESNEYTIQLRTNPERPFLLTGHAVCFDNP